MITWLKPNQPIVCVNDNWAHPRNMLEVPPDHPVKDRVYVIKGVHQGTIDKNAFYLTLAECAGDHRWLYTYFRPSRTTDLSLLTSLTVTPPQLKTLAEIEEELTRRIMESIERTLEPK